MVAPPLRTAVVGMGWWGRQIVESLSGSQWVDIKMAVEPDVDGAKAFTDGQGLDLVADLAVALGAEDIDAVIIATPHLLHESHVLAAARAGKQVFCEKPLALEAKAAKRMLGACREAGVTLGIGHERRFEGALEEMARMIGSGELGTLLHLECNWSHNLFMGTPSSTWRQDPAQAPAGTLTALGVHITDYFQSVAGPVAELRAVTSHRSTRFPGDDIIAIQMRFQSGVTGYLCSVATTPFYGRISAFGDDGWTEAREWSNVDVPEPSSLTWRGLDNEVHTRTFAHTDTVRTNLEHWAQAALGSVEYRFTEHQLLHNVEILEAIVASAASGEPRRPGLQ